MNRIKVAYLIDSLGTGGSERSLVELLPHLVAAGIEPRIFVLGDPNGGLAPLVREQGIEVSALARGSWLARVLYLRRQLTTWRPDLLHTSLFDSDVLGRLALAGTRIPVLSSLVNSSYEPARADDPSVRRWRLSVVRLIDGWTGRRLTTRFHAVSQAVADSAVKRLRLPPEAITVVRRGRDVERFGELNGQRRSAARRRWGIDNGAILAVNVGRQTYQKGQLVLLRAIRRLAGNDTPIQLVIAGRAGPCSPELESYIRDHDLGDRVRLAGHVDDVPELLAAADVFAFPSQYEGLPGAVLEAMAMGLPVVASDIPPLREVFDGRGGALLVPPGAPDRLAAALERISADGSLRGRLGCQNREAFVQRFDIRKTVPELLALYERVAGSTPETGAAP